MALTFTEQFTNVEGGKKVKYGTLAFDSSYPTGGEAITPASLGFVDIQHMQIGPHSGYDFVWDDTNGKIKVLGNVGCLTENITKAACVDVAATGTYTFTGTLPVGALPLGYRAVCSGAVSGDTSAVLSVGIAGDLDRFSADTTQSVFATGTVGSFAIAADALDTTVSALTPVVTITTASDFTNANASLAIALSVYWLGGGGSEVISGFNLSALTAVPVRILGV